MTYKARMILRTVLVVPFVLAVWLLTGLLTWSVTGSEETADVVSIVAEAVAAVGYGWWTATHPLRKPRRVDTDAGVKLPSQPRISLEPRPLEPFTTCPGCNLSGYHLLSAPRVYIPADLWKLGFGSIWNTAGTYRARCAEVEEMFGETVIDRECLSCGKTWMETDPDLAAPQARSIPDGREDES